MPLSAQLVLALTVASCAAAGATSDAQVAPTPPSSCISEADAVRMHRLSSDQIALAEAMGLRPLVRETLAAEAREVRIWYGRSMYGTRLLLQIRAADSAVQGRLAAFSSSPFGTERPEVPEPCGPVVEIGRRIGCWTVFRHPPSWAAVLDELEQHEVWSLSDERELRRPHVLLDGDGITVETRRGDCYRVYRYGNPQDKPGPDYVRPAALMRSLIAVRDQWRAGAARPGW